MGSVTIDDLVDDWMSEVSKADDYTQQVTEYRRYVYRKWLFMAACVVASVATIGVALTVGEYDIGFFETYGIIWNHLFGEVPTDVMDPMYTKDYVVCDLRMPRIITGILAGAGLAVAGAAMQSMLKNPLADPYTTGVSSGASFGATLAICAGFSVVGGGYTTVINAFVFSLIPTFVIVAVAKMKGASPTTMIMAGIAIMYIFNALTTVIKLWADPDKLSNLYSWTVGSLALTGWEDIPVILLFTIVGIAIVWLLSRQLNVLTMGDESAKSMGVNADQMRTVLLVIVALLSAAIVSFTGLIGFVGLVCPHIVRIFVGSDNRFLIPASALFGVALLLFADLVGRVVISPTTLQVGVVTAFIGGPMFLYLIIRQRKSTW